MSAEWIVAAVFVLVGIVAAIGIGLGKRDPVTRRYLPRIDAFGRFGRTAFRSEFGEERDKGEARDKNANDSGPGPSKS